MAEGNKLNTIKVSVKTPREKKDVFADEECSVEQVCSLVFRLGNVLTIWGHDGYFFSIWTFILLFVL